MKSNPYGPFIISGGPKEIPGDKVAIFVPQYNTGTKHDATGAFHPEAVHFCERWDIPLNRIHSINNRLYKSVHREGNVADALLDQMEEIQASSEKPIAIWVFFCHGYTHGIQFSIRSPGHRHFDKAYERRYERFLDILSDHPAPNVILYACSTGNDPDGDVDSAPGSGDGSFGDLLRDDLCKRGAVFSRVMTHTTAGHTTRNPMIKLLDGNGDSEGGVGGELLAMPGSKEFKKLQRLLRGDFRFEVGFMDLDSIQEALSQP